MSIVGEIVAVVVLPVTCVATKVVIAAEDLIVLPIDPEVGPVRTRARTTAPVFAVSDPTVYVSAVVP
jgi:hypothetical protein